MDVFAAVAGRRSGLIWLRLCHIRVTPPGRGCELVEEERLRYVLVEQGHVGVDREARLLVAEPLGDLQRVPASPEEDRRAGVAEAVEANPRLGLQLPVVARVGHPLPEPGLDGCWLQDAAHQVRRSDPRAAVTDPVPP